MASFAFKKPSTTNSVTVPAATSNAATTGVQQANATLVPPLDPAANRMVQQPTSNAQIVVNQATQAAMTTALATAQSTGVALTEEDAATKAGIGTFQGEWNSRDLAIPYLSIFQKSGKNFEDHPDWLGHFVWDKEFDMGDSITVVFFRASKYYLETLPFNSEKVSARFDKMEDARNAGFNPSQLTELADLDLLIEIPAEMEGAEDLARFIVADKAYLLARYTVRSTSYKIARVLMKDAGGWLKGNLINGKYELGTAKQVNGNNSWHAPTLKTAGGTSEGLRAAIIESFA